MNMLSHKGYRRTDVDDSPEASGGRSRQKPVLRIALKVPKAGWVGVLIAISMAACVSSPGVFTEQSRAYSPDSTKFLLRYGYEQGAWDGDRSYLVTVLNAKDSVNPRNISFSYTSYDFDRIYWNGNDTIIIEDSYTEYKSQGETPVKDTVLDGVIVKVIHRDPIDSTFTRKIMYRETSPDGKYDLVVYRYVKPGNEDHFLNISVIPAGDSIPKYGNFYISRRGFDCFTDVRWGDSDILECGVSSECYYEFDDYLVKHRPPVHYHVRIDDSTQGVEDGTGKRGP
jgi:hypothetical protein